MDASCLSYSCLHTRCDNGLVMWLPLEWPSEREANGMIMARGSNKLHQELVTNGSLSAGVSDDYDEDTLTENGANV